MTPRQADAAIRSGKPITVRNDRYNETFTIVIVKRDRWTVTSDIGGVFERADLTIVTMADDLPALDLNEVFPAPPSRDDELCRIANLPLDTFDDTGLELLELNFEP